MSLLVFKLLPNNDCMEKFKSKTILINHMKAKSHRVKFTINSPVKHFWDITSLSIARTIVSSKRENKFYMNYIQNYLKTSIMYFQDYLNQWSWEYGNSKVLHQTVKKFVHLLIWSFKLLDVVCSNLINNLILCSAYILWATNSEHPVNFIGISDFKWD